MQLAKMGESLGVNKMEQGMPQGLGPYRKVLLDNTFQNEWF